MHTKFWWEYPKAKYNLEDIGKLENNIKEIGEECVD
jgi:hypothetical protein